MDKEIVHLLSEHRVITTQQFHKLLGIPERTAKPAVVVSEDNRSSVNQVTATSSFTSFGSLSSPMSGFAFGPTFSSDSRLM